MESLCSSTFGYLNNVVTPEEAVDQLNGAIRANPQMTLSITNFHYEEVEVKQGENRDKLSPEEKKLKEEVEKLEKKNEDLDKQIAEAKEKYFNQKQIEQLQREKELCLQELKLLVKKQEVAKNDRKEDKKEEKKQTVRQKFVTGGETHNLIVKECLDKSDSTAFVSKLDHGTLNRVNVVTSLNLTPDVRAARKQFEKEVFDRNHTTQPHNMKKFARDVEHEI